MAKIKGNNKDNDLFGKSGKDEINGYGGDDFIFGGAGNDKLYGGAGNDEINGGVGNDLIVGGADDDVLTGGTGKDIIIGGIGHDIMTGGAGNDVFRFLPGHQSLQGWNVSDVITDFQQLPGNAGDLLEIPAGTTVRFNQPIMSGQSSIAGWYFEYGNDQNTGWVILPGLQTAPDYAFV